MTGVGKMVSCLRSQAASQDDYGDLVTVYVPFGELGCENNLCP